MVLQITERPHLLVFLSVSVTLTISWVGPWSKPCGITLQTVRPGAVATLGHLNPDSSHMRGTPTHATHTSLHSPTGEGRSILNRQIAEQTVPFYMYAGDAFRPDFCIDESARELPKGGYWCMGTEWVQQASIHPWRVMEPHKAKLFVIPFDLCASHASRKSCNGSAHVHRVEAVVAALNQSQWFHRHGGRDHLWVMPHNGLPAAMIGNRKWGFGRGRGAVFLNHPRNVMLQNMSIGRYLSYHLTLRDTTRVGFSAHQHDWLREEEKWGCTVVLPVVTPRSLWIADTTTFTQWSDRRIFLFFRGNGGLGGGCFMKSGEKAREKAVELGARKLPWPGDTIMTNEHAATVEAYRAEITDAKYCLVFACDDPQTSRFFESVAAGCIPVLINDAWQVAVAPFGSRINYAAFTITVPESVWLGDPASAAHLIYNRPIGEQRRMHAALMRARAELLWRHNESNVATNVLHAARDCFV